jgi:hypothetical protein
MAACPSLAVSSTVVRKTMLASASAGKRDRARRTALVAGELDDANAIVVAEREEELSADREPVVGYSPLAGRRGAHARAAGRPTVPGLDLF